MVDTIFNFGDRPTREQRALRVCFLALAGIFVVLLGGELVFILMRLGQGRTLSASFHKLFRDIDLAMLAPAWAICLWSASVRSRANDNFPRRSVSRLGRSD